MSKLEQYCKNIDDGKGCAYDELHDIFVELVPLFNSLMPKPKASCYRMKDLAVIGALYLDEKKANAVV